MRLIAIRKEPNGSFYIDKYFFNRFIENDLATYGYTKVEIPEDCFSDIQTSDFNEDLSFSLDKYNARKELEKTEQYEDLVVAEIRKKYSVNQELAILRQRETKTEEFEEYNSYVEDCKAKAKENLKLEVDNETNN